MVVLVSLVRAESDYSASYDEFLAKYEKGYTDLEELDARQKIWEANVELIKTHNQEALQSKHTYTLAENFYADLTPEEFMDMNGLIFDDSKADLSKAASFQHISLKDLPDTVDWRDKGYVTPVKDQAQCGSCWAFSAVGSLEGAHFAKTGKLVSLSEQNLVDCAGKEGNHGCFGGLMDLAFQYVKDNGGIDTEDSYPYTAKNGKCMYNATNSGATLTSWMDIPTGSEDDLQKAVATVGPISVAIDASRPTFQLYKTGVYEDKLCSSKFLDHGVLAVGYGTASANMGLSQVTTGKDYWLVKNSWGQTWGMNGYIMMARNAKNACGIATAASYPVV